MFKIVVIGLLYTVLSRVTGEPFVKVQVCGDVFDKAVSDSLGKIEQSEIKQSIGEINIYEYSGNGWNNGWRRGSSKGNPKLRGLPSSGMEFSNVKSKMLSTDVVEIHTEVLAYYGDSTQTASNSKKTQQNWIQAYISYWKSNKRTKAVLLYLDVIVNLRFQAKSDKLDIKIQDCQVTLKEAVSSQGDEIEAQPGRQTGTLKVKICDIFRKAIAILNDVWKDSLVIDPSGTERLIVESVLQPDSYCLAVFLNLLSNNLVEDSNQKHGYMAGSGISLLQDYFNTLLNSYIYVKQINTMLDKRDIQMSPEELNQLMEEVYETDPIVVKITILEPPHLNIEYSTITISIDLQGHAHKSDKPAFDSQFSIAFTTKIQRQKNRICFPVSGIEKLEIYSRTANMGTSGDLNVSHLEQYIKKICDSEVIPSMNDLNLCARIPNLIPEGEMIVEGTTIQVLPK